MLMMLMMWGFDENNLRKGMRLRGPGWGVRYRVFVCLFAVMAQ